MGDTTRAAEFFVNLERDRADAIAEVESSAKALEEARERYAIAVLRAHRLGVTNTMIAMVSNRTEGAIRMFLKRKKGR